MTSTDCSPPLLWRAIAHLSIRVSLEFFFVVAVCSSAHFSSNQGDTTGVLSIAVNRKVQPSCTRLRTSLLMLHLLGNWPALTFSKVTGPGYRNRKEENPSWGGERHKGMTVLNVYSLTGNRTQTVKAPNPCH